MASSQSVTWTLSIYLFLQESEETQEFEAPEDQDIPTTESADKKKRFFTKECE